MQYMDAFTKEETLITSLGYEKAYLCWAMAQYLEEADVEALASAALTDGPDDKKIDFIHLDHDAKRLVFAQGYFTDRRRDSAPANKASDLNTAVAWLLSGEVSVIPTNLRSIFEACREALVGEEIDTIEMLYVHNLPESVNVTRELQTVEEHLRKTLGNSPISLRAVELGASKTQHLFDAQDSHIEVKEDVEFPSVFSLKETGPSWTAYVASVPGIWLHQIYNRHSDALFSANYRGFLGGSRRRRVNSGIRESAETKAPDFWAFNNGITILTLGVKIPKTGPTTLSGLSIINGAQTTGSIGSVDITKNNLSGLSVLCRVIESYDSKTIADIVRYNNTQNAITSWDQYSNDPEQKRLSAEFAELGFVYNIKRGFIGSGDQLSVDEVIQPLLAFHRRPQDAIRGKNQIFDRRPLYLNAFEGKKARHVLFVYTLSKAVDERRLALKAKSNEGQLIAVEEQQLAFMRSLRFKAYFMALTAATLETALGKKCDPLTVGFVPSAAQGQTLLDLAARWLPLVNTLLALITALPDAKDFGSNMADEEFFQRLSAQLNALLHASNAAKSHEAFSTLVSGT